MGRHTGGLLAEARRAAGNGRAHSVRKECSYGSSFDLVLGVRGAKTGKGLPGHPKARETTTIGIRSAKECGRREDG